MALVKTKVVAFNEQLVYESNWAFTFNQNEMPTNKTLE